MAVFPLPVTPSRVVVRFDGFVRVFETPFSGSVQTAAQANQRWAGELIFTARDDNRGGPELMAWLGLMNGPLNRFTAGVSDNPKRGAYGGTPIIDGAAQTGKSIQLRNVGTSVTNWIRQGDYLSWIGPESQPELHIATADANSTGGGNVIIPVEPTIRQSPDDAAAVTVDDGTLGKPRGYFLLVQSENGWNAAPKNIRDMSFPFIEDIFANVV